MCATRVGSGGARPPPPCGVRGGISSAIAVCVEARAGCRGGSALPQSRQPPGRLVGTRNWATARTCRCISLPPHLLPHLVLHASSAARTPDKFRLRRGAARLTARTGRPNMACRGGWTDGELASRKRATFLDVSVLYRSSLIVPEESSLMIAMRDVTVTLRMSNQ